jgi:predicted nucleotidyltransferase
MSDKYKSALKSFVDEVVKYNSVCIPVCIYLFGGFGRGMARENWSDVDILLVYTELTSDLFKVISKIRKDVNNTHSIHLDINLLSENEVAKNQLLSIKYNSKHSNIFSGRKEISEILYGQIEPINNTHDDEKMASIFKINEAIYAFRKCMIEGDYNTFGIEDIKKYIKKAFSTIRASLVIMENYVHPYEELAGRLSKLFPDYNIDLLQKLIDIRNNHIPIESVSFPNLYVEINDFMEDYIAFVNTHLQRGGYL